MTSQDLLSKLAEKQYLGDGVYAHHDGYQIWLSTLEGFAIALEPLVMQSLDTYRKSVEKLITDYDRED